jgi:hypothetical protein
MKQRFAEWEAEFQRVTQEVRKLKRCVEDLENEAEKELKQEAGNRNRELAGLEIKLHVTRQGQREVELKRNDARNHYKTTRGLIKNRIGRVERMAKTAAANVIANREWLEYRQLRLRELEAEFNKNFPAEKLAELLL